MESSETIKRSMYRYIYWYHSRACVRCRKVRKRRK